MSKRFTSCPVAVGASYFGPSLDTTYFDLDTITTKAIAFVFYLPPPSWGEAIGTVDLYVPIKKTGTPSAFSVGYSVLGLTNHVADVPDSASWVAGSASDLGNGWWKLTGAYPADGGWFAVALTVASGTASGSDYWRFRPYSPLSEGAMSDESPTVYSGSRFYACTLTSGTNWGDAAAHWVKIEHEFPGLVYATPPAGDGELICGTPYCRDDNTDSMNGYHIGNAISLPFHGRLCGIKLDNPALAENGNASVTVIRIENSVHEVIWEHDADTDGDLVFGGKGMFHLQVDPPLLYANTTYYVFVFIESSDPPAILTMRPESSVVSTSALLDTRPGTIRKWALATREAWVDPEGEVTVTEDKLFAMRLLLEDIETVSGGGGGELNSFWRGIQ